MLKDLHVERVDIGYEGVYSTAQISDEILRLTSTFNDFFDELDEEHYLKLCEETIPTKKTVLYYLEVSMPEIIATHFVLYFGDKIKLH